MASEDANSSNASSGANSMKHKSQQHDSLDEAAMRTQRTIKSATIAMQVDANKTASEFGACRHCTTTPMRKNTCARIVPPSAELCYFSKNSSLYYTRTLLLRLDTRTHSFFLLLETPYYLTLPPYTKCILMQGLDGCMGALGICDFRGR